MSSEEPASGVQQTLSGEDAPSDEPTSLHAGNCRRDECDWNTISTSIIGLIGDLEDHMKDDHGVSDDEWRDIRDDLRRAREGR